MAVYVDALFYWPPDAVRDPQARRLAHRNNGMWCHMWADTAAELHRLAGRIGLRREWAQHPGTPHLHYDLIPRKRELAIAAGAIERTTVDWVQMIEVAEKAAAERAAEPVQQGLSLA